MSSGYVSLSEQSGWAQDLLAALGDSSTSVGTTVSWLQANLGLLNSNLGTSFSLSGSDPAISPELTQIQSGIYNELYFCYWLNRQARVMVGSMTYDWTEIQGEDQGRTRRVSNTEKGKVYQAMAKDCQANLKDLIKTYKGGDYATPRQLTFTNRHSSPKHIGYDFSWSDYNPIV